MSNFSAWKLNPARGTTSIVEESLRSRMETKVPCPNVKGTVAGSLCLNFCRFSQATDEGNHVNLILRHIPYVQNNFVLGLDCDLRSGAYGEEIWCR